MNFWTQNENNIFVAAHRGFSAKYPENTILAFKAALDVGVDQLETDVRITKDKELVLIHDATLDRTTNGKGKVCDYTLEELKKLDAGQGQQIPTLREFLELVKDHPTITLDIELKEYPIDDWEQTAYYTCIKAIEMIEEYGFGDRCVINSFNMKLNEFVFAEFGGKYKQHLFFPPMKMNLDEQKLPLYSFGYCACIMGYTKGMATLEEVKEFHEKTGLQVWAGAEIKDEATVDMAIGMGANLITCNNPDEILEILRNKGLHK